MSKQKHVGAVQVNEPGRAFQFTSAGMADLDFNATPGAPPQLIDMPNLPPPLSMADLSMHDADHEAPHPAVGARPVPLQQPRRALQYEVRAQPAAQRSVQKPGDLLKAARARVREIQKEMKHMRALEKELAELQRLLQAAQPATRRNQKQTH